MRSQTVVVTPPAQIISLDDARQHLRVDDLDNDGTINGFLQAAIAMLDGPDAWLGRALGQQTLELRLPTFLLTSYERYEPGSYTSVLPNYDTWTDYASLQGIKLLCPPVQSIVGITYLDSTETLQTVDPASYQLADRTVSPVAGGAWPAALFAPNSVRIQYVAGYDLGQVPAPIISAIKLMLGTLYEGRDTSTAGMFTGAISYLLANYRVVT